MHARVADVIADAQKNLIYVQPFARASDKWTAAGELQVRPFVEWLGDRQHDGWVSGPGLEKWGLQVPADVICIEEDDWCPQVESLLELGFGAASEPSERDDVFALEPLYLRASSAEEQWRGRRE